MAGDARQKFGPYLTGYARMSKGEDQSNAAQTRAFDAAGCRRVFEETTGGGRWDRPRLREMIGQLRAGNVVVVWKLDRPSRSPHIMDGIEAAGAQPHRSERARQQIQQMPPARHRTALLAILREMEATLTDAAITKFGTRIAPGPLAHTPTVSQ